MCRSQVEPERDETSNQRHLPGYREEGGRLKISSYGWKGTEQQGQDTNRIITHTCKLGSVNPTIQRLNVDVKIGK